MPTSGAPSGALNQGPLPASVSLNAVGVILKTVMSETPKLHCTGTLIAPNKVLSAKHCVTEGIKARTTLSFALGESTDRLQSAIGIVEADILFREGFSGTRGSDMGVALIRQENA